jgi:hypothetical protein
MVVHASEPSTWETDQENHEFKASLDYIVAIWIGDVTLAAQTLHSY